MIITKLHDLLVQHLSTINTVSSDGWELYLDNSPEFEADTLHIDQHHLETMLNIFLNQQLINLSDVTLNQINITRYKSLIANVVDTMPLLPEHKQSAIKNALELVKLHLDTATKPSDLELLSSIEHYNLIGKNQDLIMNQR